MLQSLRPDAVLDGVWDVDPAELRARGIRLLLSDLDNTLTDYRDRRPDERVAAWIERLNGAGITLVVLSNNHNPERVRAFCEPLGLPFCAHSRKPRPDALLAAMEAHKAAPCETLMVGDQIFTDVRAAKRAGVRSVLVRPYRMSFWFWLRRAAERPFYNGVGRTLSTIKGDRL